jgi:hypothetical protein
MLVATLEDLQGSVEVVVFPKVFADTANSWTDDSVVLVSGRVDHRDEASQLLCEVVQAWEDAVRMGPVAFGAERDRLLGARGRPGTWVPNGAGGGGNGRGGAVAAQPEPGQPPVAVPRGAASPPAASTAAASTAAVAIPIAVAEASDEPTAPPEAIPLPASPAGAGTIAIGFDDDVPMDRLLPAIELVTQAILDRPGPLPVVISIPVAGATRQVRLPHLAEWDERLAEAIRQAAGLSLAVELRPAATEP